jgi:hypothetical protein
MRLRRALLTRAGQNRSVQEYVAPGQADSELG